MSGEESVVVRGSRRDAGSNQIRPAPRIGGELADSREIGFLKVGMLVENLLFGHPGAQPAEDIPDRDSQSADARLSAARTRLNGDPAKCSLSALEALLRERAQTPASRDQSRENAPGSADIHLDWTVVARLWRGENKSFFRKYRTGGTIRCRQSNHFVRSQCGPRVGTAQTPPEREGATDSRKRHLDSRGGHLLRSEPGYARHPLPGD